MTTPGKSSDIHTVIGPDAKFKGELTFSGGVRIEGAFDGSIQTDGTVLVSKGGQTKADIQAGSVVVEGQIEGGIVAKDRVELNGSAEMHGDLEAKTLVVKEGAVFVGRCSVGAPAGAKSQASSNKKAIADAAAGRK